MRKSLTALLTLATVAAVAVPASTASAKKDNLRVYVSNCEKQVYKPKTITVFCADAGVVINKIKYTDYTSKIARGQGTATVNLCEPNCAAGKTQKFDVRFTLSKVKQCGDSYQFRKLQTTYIGKKPKGKRTQSQSFPCADAPTG
jgi:hypothetical protein